MTPRPKFRALLRLLRTPLLAARASLLVLLRSWNGSSWPELASRCNSVFRGFVLYFSGALKDLLRGTFFPLTATAVSAGSRSLSSEDSSRALLPFFMFNTWSMAGVFSVLSSMMKLLVLFLPLCCLTGGL